MSRFLWGDERVVGRVGLDERERDRDRETERERERERDRERERERETERRGGRLTFDRVRNASIVTSLTFDSEKLADLEVVWVGGDRSWLIWWWCG